MIASMTGFARRELAGSLGHPHLRAAQREPPLPGARIPAARRAAAARVRLKTAARARHLKRGKVDCTVHLRSVQAAERELRIDAAALARVAAAVGQVSRAVPGSHRRRRRSAALARRHRSRQPRTPKPC